MGSFLSLYRESFPPHSTFSVADIPDLSGKVVIVTGGTAGIGKEITKGLLAHNAKVYVSARSRSKAEDTILELKRETGKEASFIQMDLADLHSVKAAAEDFLSKESQLHILFNNAGIMFPPVEQLTVDGYDLQFGTNVLGHFYLTKLLLPILLDTAKTVPSGKAHVVNTSSAGHLFGGLDFNTFKDSPARIKAGSNQLYFQSKFGNVVLSAELARRYGDHGLVSCALNPGNIKSESQGPKSPMEELFFGWVFWPTAYGALTPLYAGASSESDSLNGKYIVPWARVGAPHPVTQDPLLGKELWEWLEEQVQDI